MRIVNFEWQTVGANVNEKMFRGFATTAAVMEDHIEILKILLNGGASQPACEEALLEAAYLGRAPLAELIMESKMVRPHVAVHGLVIAGCRGFVEVVDALIKVKSLLLLHRGFSAEAKKMGMLTLPCVLYDAR